MFFIDPYIFCGVLKSFVQVQFRTRYCGHTLSRLTDFCHNMTKQCILPTVRRREPEQGDLSIACVLLGETHLVLNKDYKWLKVVKV